MTGSARNLLWHLGTSALYDALILPAFGSYYERHGAIRRRINSTGPVAS